jgi:hypothetical protein
MKLKILSISAIFLLLNIVPVFAQYDYDIPISKIERRAQEKYVKNHTRKNYRFNEDTVIQADSSIDGNVIIVRGSLTVLGRITGDVLAVLGDIFIKPGAEIGGNVTSVNGIIEQSGKSIVAGNQIETRVKNLYSFFDWDYHKYKDFDIDRDYEHNDDHKHYKYNLTYIIPDYYTSMAPVVFKYNRVQGLFLGLTVPKDYISRYNALKIHGFGGYGFREKNWDFELGVNRWFFDRTQYRFELGAEVYDLTDTKDDWYISHLENSLASILIHEDYQDFYRRSGFNFHASQNLSEYFKGTITYSNDEYESVEKNTDWAIFGGKKKFRQNPLIDEGNMRSLHGELYLDTRNSHDNPNRGWFAKLGIETSNSGLNSDFSFNQYIFEVRRYQKLSFRDRLDMRIKAVTSEGSVPRQRLYQLGGAGTMRGFKNKFLRGGDDSFGGDRMLLINLEYIISPKIFGRDFLFDGDARYIIFFDAGNVWNRAAVSDKDEWSSGFSHLKLNDLKSDLGLAITSWSGNFRVSLAKRLDTNYRPVIFTVRLNKPF